MQTKTIAIGGIILFIGSQWLVQVWEDWHNSHYFSGYVETDVRYFASPQSAALKSLNVQRGEIIEVGKVLFEVDPISTQKQIAQIQAQKKLADIDLARKQSLFQKQAIPQSDLDSAIAADQELLDQLAGLEHILDQLAPQSPQNAHVEYTYFNTGEWVEANRPIVSLIIPTEIKIRFFIPEPQLAHVTVGSMLEIECDGCQKNQKVKVSYLSPTAEYTPPMIYSRDERHKLLFMCEAYLEPTQPLPIGLPVLVRAPK